MKARIESLKPIVYDSNTTNDYSVFEEDSFGKQIEGTRHLTLEINGLFLRSVSYIVATYTICNEIHCGVCDKDYVAQTTNTTGYELNRVHVCDLVPKHHVVFDNCIDLKCALPHNIVVESYICSGCCWMLRTLQVIKLVASDYNRLLVRKNADLDAAINYSRYRQIATRLVTTNILNVTHQYKLWLITHVIVRDVWKYIIRLYWKC